MGARNQGGIGLSYHPDRLHRLVELTPGILKCLKILSLAGFYESTANRVIVLARKAT
jgi:hypothetical protein